MATAVAEPAPSEWFCHRDAVAGENLTYSDFMRAAGILAVILVHVAHEGTRIEGWIGKPEWWWCATFDAMGRWAVPVFLMVGGAIFLHPSRRESARAFYRKRLVRIGVPMAFWSAFYLAWYVFFQQPVWGYPALGRRDLLELLLSGATASHLHYLGVVMGLYVFTPMLRIYTWHAPRQQLCWATGIILVITVLSDAVAALQDENVLRHALIFNRFVPYLGYYLLGFCLRDVRPTRQWCLWTGLAYVAAVAVTVVGTRYLLARFGAEHGGFYFYGQLSPTRPVMAMAVFMLAKAIARQAGSLARLSAFCASLTLGVYLVHPVFMDLLAWAGLYVMTPNVWVGLPLRLLAVYVISMVVVWLLRLLPGSRYLVG
jgi:surface polysaccharide O-acyltransferase-like enzyme